MISIDQESMQIVMRLFAATAAGMLIGLNRNITQKPIGMRTLGLVSLGAAIVTISSVNFQNLSEYPDPLSRVVQGAVQGIMAGISFIGAGVILRNSHQGTVRGLTTAATVWVAAALGIACGLGAWIVVLASVAITLTLLVVVGWIEIKLGIDDGDE